MGLGVMWTWGCAFYLLLIPFDGRVLNNIVGSQSVDGARPAEAACKKYRKIANELGLTRVESSNGHLPNLGEFPYLAAVGLLNTRVNDGRLHYSRAGVLISDKHVLTTSFSVRTSSGRIPVEVVLGSMDPANASQIEGAQRIRISRIIRYPQYDRRFYYRNIAILVLERPVVFTVYVQPTCLMTEPLTSRTEGANTSLVIVSWSFVYWYNIDEPIRPIKITEQRFVGKSECSNFYDTKSPFLPKGLDDDMICLTKATDNTKMRDPCWGRTGTPVLIPFNDTFLLIGLTSFIYKCPSTVPTVAVSTYKYLNWIEDQVWPDMSREGNFSTAIIRYNKSELSSDDMRHFFSLYL